LRDRCSRRQATSEFTPDRCGGQELAPALPDIYLDGDDFDSRFDFMKDYVRGSSSRHESVLRTEHNSRQGFDNTTSDTAHPVGSCQPISPRQTLSPIPFPESTRRPYNFVPPKLPFSLDPNGASQDESALILLSSDTRVVPMRPASREDNEKRLNIIFESSDKTLIMITQLLSAVVWSSGRSQSYSTSILRS
jgi:hypothetical protein